MYKLAVLDDEGHIVDGIVNLFPWTELGFEVVIASTNALETLQKIREIEVDVLLCDISMPQLTGIEMCEKMKLFKTKIVFMSSYQKYEYFRSAIQYGVEDYLLKPIKGQELNKVFTRIREQLDQERSASVDISKHDVDYYEKIVYKTEAYILANYRECTLEEVAAYVHLSSGYFSKIFKEISGRSFQDYRLECKMEKACEFLKDENIKIYEVAHYVGYSNPKNFGRVFKTYFGKTPREYKREI